MLIKLAAFGMLFASSTLLAAEPTTLKIFDRVLFYDGYAAKVNFPTAEGVIRHRNDLFARKLTDSEIQLLGRGLQLNIRINAACDNYDRIGSFNLAFVPKGSETYIPEQVQRIEVGRFITPFMNKNIAPFEVPYTFSIDPIVPILKGSATDIWAELEVFGVPYAANNEVAGCKNRNDVFYGSVDFVTNQEPAKAERTFLLPLNFKKNLNNYTPGASDVLKKTVRNIRFHLEQPIQDATFHLITSNHGANAGGEEYNRRNHLVSLDGTLLSTYKPGGISCEPYRIYNTQGNGIYSPYPRTPEVWASFSNWCPGQAIPIRDFKVGNLAAGDHSFQISVPDAVFVGAQGDIPVSVYLQGTLNP